METSATTFLCRYPLMELRRAIHGGLNVIESWNSANDFIFFGKGGEIASNRAYDQEISMLSLHLVQLLFVNVNTPMIQQVLAEPLGRMSQRRRSARLNPARLQLHRPVRQLPARPQCRLCIDPPPLRPQIGRDANAPQLRPAKRHDQIAPGDSDVGFNPYIALFARVLGRVCDSRKPRQTSGCPPRLNLAITLEFSCRKQPRFALAVP